MAATAVALIWANSGWRHSYERLLHLNARIGIGDFSIDKSLLHWVNDGVMALFFFVVGLEIKRELIVGELSTPRKAALPIAGAIGGMLVPAVIYFAINGDGAGGRGWGIPMATDIAFALGVLLLLESRVPPALKVFLTALAIVDDIGAIAVIAVFYTDTIALGTLAVGIALIAMSAAANVAGVRSVVFYLLVGTLVWVCFLKSGIHATLAAVLMAMTIPARSHVDGGAVASRVEQLLARLRELGLPEAGKLPTADQQHVLHAMKSTVADGSAPLQDLEHALMPLVTFLVLPLFALANAGVHLGGDIGAAFSDPICLGIIAGLFAGKQLGIFLFAAVAVRAGIADLPEGVRWRQLHAVSVLAGIGFTMSLFVSSLAFPEPAMQHLAKIGILSATLVSALVGALLLLTIKAEAPADST